VKQLSAKRNPLNNSNLQNPQSPQNPQIPQIPQNSLHRTQEGEDIYE
jgi:hypothetical protein